MRVSSAAQVWAHVGYDLGRLSEVLGSCIQVLALPLT